MRGVVITAPGGPEVLEIRELAMPEPGPEQVRVRVRATAMNRADLLQRMGAYPAPLGVPADIPGMEFAGVIDVVGANAGPWKPGDRVFGLVGGGSNAEYLVTHARALARIPDALDDVQAASVPEAFITAHDALFAQGRLATGDDVLVHSVGSGVGLAAIQLAHVRRARVFGTARTEEKLKRAARYGLDHAMLPAAFDDAVLAATGGNGVDVLVDFVGADYLERNLRSMASCGRMVVVGVMGGGVGEINLAMLLSKRIHVVGTSLRSRPLEEKIAVTQRFAREVVPLLASREVVPVVDRVFKLDEVREAHAYMATNANFGKIVITV